MAHAQICPVCLGKGILPADKYSTAAEEKCHGCNGRGWVEVSDEPAYYPPILPVPWPTIWPHTITISPATPTWENGPQAITYEYRYSENNDET